MVGQTVDSIQLTIREWHINSFALYRHTKHRRPPVDSLLPFLLFFASVTTPSARIF